MSFNIVKEIYNADAYTLTGNTLAPNVRFGSIASIQNITTTPGITNISGMVKVYETTPKTLKFYPTNVPPFDSDDIGGMTASGTSSNPESLIMYWPTDATTGDDLYLCANNTQQVRLNETAGVKTTTITGDCTVSGSTVIGSTTQTASAVLSLSSTTKGFLMPRMTTAEKNAISSPATGLQVFDTTLSEAQVYALYGGWTKLNVLHASVVFNGSTLAIAGSVNVSSVTKIGTGIYQINFTVPTSNTNYGWVGSCGYTSSTAQSNYLAAPHTTDMSTWKTTTYLQVQSYYGNTLTDRDVTSCSVTIFS